METVALLSFDISHSTSSSTDFFVRNICVKIKNGIISWWLWLWNIGPFSLALSRRQVSIPPCCNYEIFSVEQLQWPHGLWLLLWTQPAQPGSSSPLWSLWEIFQLHQPEENLRWLLQYLLLFLSSSQGGTMLSLWSSQPETPTPRGTDEAEGEGPPAFPHQETNQHQVLRRWVQLCNLYSLVSPISGPSLVTITTSQPASVYYSFLSSGKQLQLQQQLAFARRQTIFGQPD